MSILCSFSMFSDMACVIFSLGEEHIFSEKKDCLEIDLLLVFLLEEEQEDDEEDLGHL